jgi:DNA-binding response OmpR family regulator
MPATYRTVEPCTTGYLRVLTIGDVELHLDGHRLLVRGEPVPVTRKEFLILTHLMTNAGRVLTRDDMLNNVWGPELATSRNYLEVHIHRLRVKLGESHRIRTVRGTGYVFDLPHDR